MFKKPVKIKSNTQVKGSERKTFKDLLLKTFPNLTEVDINDFLPKKEILNSLKIVTHDETIVHVYAVQKRPMIFDVKGRIFPSVFLLWRFPNLVYSFTTHQQVMNFISSGADLMLPGVLTPPPQTNLSKYGCVSENELVYVNMSSNKAAIAVGVASQSSASMALANGRGKCVVINHFYGDNLCTLEGMPNLPIPNNGPPDWFKFKSYEEDFPSLGTAKKSDLNTPSKEIPEEEAPEISKVEEVSEESKEEEDDDMDEFLTFCFFGAIKYTKPSLPVLTSNFYKLHMLPFVPENRNLDIKKTSYKKLKPFLEKMCEEGLITLKEIKKGVEAIATINQSHSKYIEFYINPENRPSRGGMGDDGHQTDVVESYIITPNVIPIFQDQGYQRGDIILPPDVRKCVTKYIKDNNLQDADNAKLVIPRDVLASVCKTTNPINWEEVIEKVCDSMKNCFKVKTGNEEILNKGKVSPITMSVSVRSGNKKVTLVDNLELFGIRIADFAKECQHGVAASTSISRPPGKKSDQLLVQGNQVLFIYNLLTEKYKIQKKYIKGLENAPKKKN